MKTAAAVSSRMASGPILAAAMGSALAAAPVALTPGIHPLSDTQVLLCLQAPGKSKVQAVGDFNQWTPSAQNTMAQEGDLFWIQIDNLTPGKEYIFQYWIDDGAVKVGDPYADKIVDYNSDPQIIKEGSYPDLIPYTRQYDGLASVFTAGMPKPAVFSPFVRPAPENLLIYETLIRDFTKSHTFREMQDSLAYFKRLGVNAIELMPTTEFENNDSWGYNPTYFFAVDKYYGPAEDLKALIQAAHGMGMAVILDIVMNHAMGQSPLVSMYWDAANKRPIDNAPYANVAPKHDYNVGYDLNYESPYTRAYFKRMLQHWLTDYHFDGYRIDLSKGLTQKNTLGDVAAWGHLDTSRINILTDLASAARQADSGAYLILEHFADNDEETILSSKGFLLWGNSSYDHGYAAMGQVDHDFKWADYQNRGWTQQHLVSYMESHDEERIAAKNEAGGSSNGDYNIRDFKTSLERSKEAALFLFGIPGPKMLWEFGEWGDDRPRGTTADERMGHKPLPADWPSDASRKRVYGAYSGLLHFRQQFQNSFKDGAFTWNPAGAVRWWKLSHPGLHAYALGNFGVTDASYSLDLPGTWYDFFSREKITLKAPAQITLKPGEYHLLSDQPVFAPVDGLTDFRLPASLSPEVVSVRALPASRPAAAPSRLRMEDRGHFLPEVLREGAANRPDGRRVLSVSP